MHGLFKPAKARPARNGQLLALLLGYLELHITACEARDVQRLPRASPVGRSLLHERWLDDDLLLWLLYQGHVEHLTPSAAPGGGLESTTSLRLTDASAFALTPAGEAFAEFFLCGSLFPRTQEESDTAWSLIRTGLLLPHYDEQDRILRWGYHVLKRFRQPSVNQQIVLASAEELAWPEWFDDPLSPRPGKNPKVRLHDTIKDLNRRQRSYLVHFKGDGTGRRIGWELR